MANSPQIHRLVMKITQEQEDRINLLKQTTGLTRSGVVNLAITELAARKATENKK